MGIAISDEHVALEASARKFLAARVGSSVLRANLESTDDVLPPFWEELVGLGWLGLLAEGFGLAEVAVVLEATGRACAPGPFLPTVLAAAAIRDGAADPAGLLGRIAAGEPATIDFAGDGHVLSGGAASLFVLPSDDVPDEDGWAVFERGAVAVTPVGSLDLVRKLATVAIEGRPLCALPMLSTARVQSLAAAMVAAECAGGAAWCVETAAEYAKQREQFGRPIGQFQGVKHRCANMLVAAEQAGSLAWDAAAAVDAGDADVATLAAAALAPDAFVETAKDCIQVLGGMGFTWEHDAHLYLRRAMSLRQLLGGGSAFRRRLASVALGGARRTLTVDLPEGPFRDEVRAFAAAVKDLPRAEQRRRVVEAGYFMPHWPPPWGRDAGAVEQLVIDEELRAARVRRPNLAVGAWAAPTIVAHGTVEQQERWVRPTLTGEINWCQLFSEPGAGSDLAALTTAATKVDGGWAITGQKVWTSMARDADWGICLARTNRTAPKHLGITYFIVDMKSAGIDIRPLREMTGFEMFNEVFLTDVFVADDCVIGEVDGGWPLARTTLANERVAMGSGSSFGGGVEQLLALAGSLDLDAVAMDHLGGLVAEAQSVALLGLRSTHRSLAGAKPGPEASVRKLLGVEHDQRTQEFGLSLLGAAGASTVGAAEQWTFGFLANRCLTIAGGTSEVQRNVIGERLLGLPRDP